MVLVTVPQCEPRAAAAFSVKWDAPMGCTRNREALVNSGSWEAVRELASVEAIAKATIIEIDAILALPMPNPTAPSHWSRSTIMSNAQNEHCRG
jgi:hypothetical protein